MTLAFRQIIHNHIVLSNQCRDWLAGVVQHTEYTYCSSDWK